MAGRRLISFLIDPNVCASDGIQLGFTHPGFPAGGHYELPADGAPVLSLVHPPYPMNALTSNRERRRLLPAIHWQDHRASKQGLEAQRPGVHLVTMHRMKGLGLRQCCRLHVAATRARDEPVVTGGGGRPRPRSSGDRE